MGLNSICTRILEGMERLEHVADQCIWEGPRRSKWDTTDLTWKSCKLVRGQNVSQTKALSGRGSKEVIMGLILIGTRIIEVC